MKKLFFISVALLALSIQSCKKDYLYVQKFVPPPPDLSFATNIYPLMTSYNCANCHSPGDNFPDLSTSQNAYSDITTGNQQLINSNPASSRFYIAVTSAYNGISGQMPTNAPYLTSNEQELVLAWISQGAKP